MSAACYRCQQHSGESNDWLPAPDKESRLQEATGLPLRTFPQAAVQHPYWNNGNPQLSRFYNWAFGDGMLLDQYPRYSYSVAPNATELLLLTLAVTALPFTSSIISVFATGLMHEESSGASLEDFSPNRLSNLLQTGVFQFWPRLWTVLWFLLAALMTQIADFILIFTDLLFRAWKSKSLPGSPENSVHANGGCGVRSRDEILMRAGLEGYCDACMLYAVAVQAKSVLLASEYGRLMGHFRRGRFWVNFGKRFMWWGLRNRSVVEGERRHAWNKCVVLCGAWMLTLVALQQLDKPHVCMVVMNAERLTM